MKRLDRIKLNISRNLSFVSRERITNYFKPTEEQKKTLKDVITWLTKEDIAIYVNANSYIEWQILCTGSYEEEIGKVLVMSLNEGDNAIDVGANIGLQSIRMAKRVGKSGKVLAFEPLAYLQQKLMKNVGLNCVTNVLLLPFALSNNNTEATFSINSQDWNQGTFSLRETNRGSELQKVNIRIGDDLPEITSLESLALIKIDVEGFEYQVIKGLQNIIKKYLPRLVFEYEANYWNANNQNFNECFSWLSSLGYTMYDIKQVGCHQITDSSMATNGGNLLCIPKSNTLSFER